jgi:NAD+ kinase
MTPSFQRIALVGKYHAQGMSTLLSDIAQFLSQQGCEVLLEQETAAHTGLQAWGSCSVDELGKRCNVAVVVGGDGTMLGVARQLARHQVPLIGIHQGRLGFMTDVMVDEYVQTLGPMLQGRFEEERRSMVEGGVWRDGECIFSSFALNDVVVSRGSSASMVELRVEIGKEFVANIRADGLIVGTPTGSTAYALSAGGPILHPSIAAWVVVPIAPHDLSNRPIVLPDSAEVAIEIVAGKDATVSFDMHSLASLQPGDRILVRRSVDQVRFLHPVGWSYFATLRRKLRWNSGLALV